MKSNANAPDDQLLNPSLGRARLLQNNRRVRHLHGIALRNLNLDPQGGRERGKTFDDEALPFALTSPVKLLPVEHRDKLVYSRSHDNLKSLKSVGQPSTVTGGTTIEDEISLKFATARPRKPRRSSTLEWASTTSDQRQETLREAVTRRTADVFFSLHVPVQQAPIYISEVVKRATNPTFRAFDLHACPGSITRRDSLGLRLWGKHAAEAASQLLMETTISLPSLQFIGTTLEDFRHPFPDNCLIFHLTDGVYTSSTDVPLQSNYPPNLPLTNVNLHDDLQSTSSYDSLMRLATLDECIQDAVAVREKLTAEINALIESNRDAFSANDRLAQGQDDLSKVKRSTAEERRNVRSSRAKVSELRANIQARRDAIARGLDAQKRSAEHLKSNDPQLERCRKSHADLQDNLLAQRRRICSDLGEIYTIDPTPKRALVFEIRQILLPNSDFSNAGENPTSAGLGFVAHLVYLLSMYLSIPLPYTISPRSSTSTITDSISNMTGNRIFPLYMHGTIFYRFEYGVFLLNKNIELLASRLGLKILDIRQTLPNLKYILYVATAGKGELPARKVGGVRGLLAKRGDSGTPDSSRMSSPDGTVGSELSLRRKLAGIGKLENGRAIQTTTINDRQID